LLSTAAPARDLADILQEKGVISASEAAEARAALAPEKMEADEPAKEKEQAATEKTVSTVPALPERVKMVTLSGDIRIRNEVLFQKGTEDRVRQRFRLRFGVKAKPSDEIETGFKLASGNPDDPISNNQTFTDEFTPKDVKIANAYIKLTPYNSIGLDRIGFDRPWLTAMGGKFDQLTALFVKTGYMALAYWYGEHKQFDFGIWIVFAVGNLGGVREHRAARRAL
jgi:hypothetical protein